METITETSEHQRELTKTEIEIATAQIIDRMTRACKASTQITKAIDNASDDDLDDSKWADYKAKAKAKACAKYEIPPHVDVYLDGCHMREYLVKPLKPFIKKWVQGALTNQDMDNMYFLFFSFMELDFLWVFLDKPGYFYEWEAAELDGVDQDALTEEFKALGTRVNKKNKGGGDFYDSIFRTLFGWPAYNKKTASALQEMLG